MGKKEDLGYSWSVKLTDNSTINQFDGETENPFSLVEDEFGNIKEFTLSDAEETEVFGVIFSAQKLYSQNLEYVLDGDTPELIYKRRNDIRMEVGGGGTILNANVTHIIGLKTSTDEQQFEIFGGQGVKPKKVKIKDTAGDTETDITDSY